MSFVGRRSDLASFSMVSGKLRLKLALESSGGGVFTGSNGGMIGVFAGVHIVKFSMKNNLFFI